MTPDTTRRGLLGGAGLASFALVAPVGAVAPATPGISPELAALIADYDSASRALDAYETDFAEPMMARARAKSQALPYHRVVIDDREYGTDDNVAIATAGAILAGSRSCKAYCRPWRSLLAAHKVRERAVRRIWRETGAAAACEKSDALGNAKVQAQYAVAGHPVSTVADLAAKLAFMVEHDMGDGTDWLPELNADAQRIAGEA